MQREEATQHKLGRHSASTSHRGTNTLPYRGVIRTLIPAATTFTANSQWGRHVPHTAATNLKGPLDTPSQG